MFLRLIEVRRRAASRGWPLLRCVSATDELRPKRCEAMAVQQSFLRMLEWKRCARALSGNQARSCKRREHACLGESE